MTELGPLVLFNKSERLLTHFLLSPTERSSSKSSRDWSLWINASYFFSRWSHLLGCPGLCFPVRIRGRPVPDRNTANSSCRRVQSDPEIQSWCGLLILDSSLVTNVPVYPGNNRFKTNSLSVSVPAAVIL